MRCWVLVLVLLAADGPCAGQVSTMGTTAMGLPTVPGVIVSSPLNGPSPFTSLAQGNAPVTTLAPVAMAQDPTEPGTTVTCSTAASGTTASTPSAMSTIPSPIGNPLGTSNAGSSFNGTVSPSPPLGLSTLTGNCILSGSAPANGAALPLFVPAIPIQPVVGTIQAGIIAPTSSNADLGAMSPTPNASACSESVTIDLTAPAMSAANASGAAATPGVAPAGC